MPTVIFFAGQTGGVIVDQEPHEVAAAFAAADGVPFRLTGADGRDDLYVNPAMVAFWSGSDAAPEPQKDSPQSIREREPVTNIWGQPVRKRPRR